MNPIFKTLVLPLLKKLIAYAFKKLESYAIDQFIEALDRNGDKLLSKQELKEYKTMTSYVKKFKPKFK